ncbi:Zinc finger BED domain-containing protein 1 [Merluccius polli]|uniref:Zinc finger BED domain-containing protein 1 n=1 Tax=Merluccius polli TaxID=89951 RepID=A0AA47M8C2_MERPO|nr:Zinc finger BED domain-containing protein 1 [Merluccius polli]
MTCMTKDSGANMVRAMELNSWIRLQCFGHRLHLAIEKSAKAPCVDRTTSICKKVVSTFSFSWKKSRDMSKAQTELKLPQQITESPTRWGSRLNMIESEKAISQVLKADKKTRHFGGRSVKKAPSPLRDFTNALSGKWYVSVSYVKPVLHLLKVNILNLNDDNTELTKTMKTTILDYLTAKYQDPTTDDLLDMALHVDPRFNAQYIDSDKTEGIQARAVSELKSTTSLLTVQAQHPAASAQPQPTSTSTTQSPEAEQTPPKKGKKMLASFLKISGAVTAATAASPSLKEAIDGELKAYLFTPNADSEMDPLEWWKVHEGNFPRVSQLARKYLCIPATSAPSESRQHWWQYCHMPKGNSQAR